MAGLQRSAISFRRQGSSGLVWDDKLLTASGELIPANPDRKSRDDRKDEVESELRRSKSDGGGRRAYRSVKVQDAEDPPRLGFLGVGFAVCLGSRVVNELMRRENLVSGNPKIRSNFHLLNKKESPKKEKEKRRFSEVLSKKWFSKSSFSEFYVGD